MPRRRTRDFLFPRVDVVAGWRYRGRTCCQGAGGHKIPGRDAEVNHARRPIGSEAGRPYIGGHSPWSVSFASSVPGLSRSGLARRLREERAHQRAEDCTTTLRACGLGVVVCTYGEGDAYVPATVVTVVFVHRHRGSSSRLHGPVTVPPHGAWALRVLRAPSHG